MAQQKPASGNAPAKKGISYSSKFGLDPNRKKLSTVTDEKKGTFYPGPNFTITKIQIVDSKKRYSHEDRNTGEMTTGKIGIAQFDGITEKGEPFMVYSPNAPIVEACEQILDDKDFAADVNGILGQPVIIGDVISGQGEQNRNYLAFQ